LTEGWLRTIKAFPQKDDPNNRVFYEAKLSTCIYVAEKRAIQDSTISIDTYPGKSLIDNPKRCLVSLLDLKTLDSLGANRQYIANSLPTAHRLVLVGPSRQHIA